MPRLSPFVFAATFAALLAPVALSAQTSATTQPSTAPRLITDRDIFDFHWIGETQIAPHGDRAVFVGVKINAKKTGYETSLWIQDLTQPGAQPVQLTQGTHDSSPRWSPDGGTLAFMRSEEKDGKPAPAQIYLLPLTGGEPHAITSLPGGAARPSFSPDGKHILFASDTNPDDLAKAGKKPAPEEHVSDVRVITQASYRSNGQGYLDFTHPSHLWVQDLDTQGASGKPRQLTSGRFDETSPAWLPDSSAVLYLTDKQDEPYYHLAEAEIDRVAVSGGEPQTVTKVELGVRSFSLSPDGKKIAFHAQERLPVHSYTQPDLWVLSLDAGAKPHNLTTQFDFDMGSGVGGDNSAPRGAGPSAPLWSQDGEHILDLVGKKGEANLALVDTGSGKVIELTHGQQSIESYTALPDWSRVLAVISTPVAIGDLFTLDAKTGAQKQLTDVNHELFSKLKLTQPEEIWVKSFDGRMIQTWVQRPPDYDPAKKYPLILDIHGGPHSAYGWVFDHEFQWFAAKGYVVVYPNPRGSTTYGQEFGNLIEHKYPGDDFHDLMAAVDEVIRRGGIDTQKLGVTGGSGGGVLTDWTVTHTNRFKAAVSQRDISDWTSWWYTVDFLQFQPTWFKGAPFNEPEDFRSRSAITFVKNIQTPLMFILGEADYRTPPTAGGEQLFRALKYMHEPTVMVRFPGESHELSRSGQPWHRVERLDNIIGWFDKYLEGQKKPEYDIAPGITPQPDPHPYAGEPAVR